MWLAWIALQRQNSCLAFSTLRLLHGARKSNQIRTAARSRVAPPRPPLPRAPSPDTRSLSPASLYADRRRLDSADPKKSPPWPRSHPATAAGRRPISGSGSGSVSPEMRAGLMCAGLRCPLQVYCFPLQMRRSGAAPSCRPPLIPSKNAAALD